MKKGAILSYLSMLITILVAFLYTPIMIRLLGQSEYGLYAMIGAVATYFGILDLGLGNAVTRYTSRNRAIGNKTLESKLNGMFLTLFTLFGLLVLIFGTIFYTNIENIFAESLDATEIIKAKIMVIILIINYTLSFPLMVFGSIVQAYERFVFIKVLEIVRVIAVPMITLPILFAGFGSIAMVVINSIVNIGILLLKVYYCFKYLKIKFYFGKIDSSLLKEILGYSFFVFLGIIVDRIYWSTDQFILGAIVGTVPVAIYAIAMQFINVYMKFSTSISGLFLPRASMMVAKKSSDTEITENMIKYGRIQFVILTYILSGFILFGRPFINFWAGNNYDQAFIITLIIMIPLTIPLFQNFGISVLYAKNMQKFRSIVLIFIAILNVIITIPLVKGCGVIGAAIGTALSLTLGNTIIMNIYYHKRVGINMIKFWNSILKLTIPINLSLFIGLIMTFLTNLENIYLMPISIIIYSTIYISLLWIMGFNTYEKKLVISAYQRVHKILFR